MKTDNIQSARARHHAALVTLYTGKGPAPSGLSLWRKLRRLESEAHDSATAQCNGAAYGTQPFRPDHLPDGSEGTEENPTPWETYAGTVRARVAKIFGKVPPGFRFNLDARGYALKIDPDKGPVPEGMQTDWGGNGLLAASIN
jgi:hypothetical protein